MKLAVCTTTSEVPVPVPVALLSGSFQERLDKAAALGCDGLELMVLNPDQLDVDRVAGEIRSRDLEVAAIGTGAQLFVDQLTLLAQDRTTENRALERFGKLVGVAAACGAPIGTVGSFRGKLAGSGERARERIVDTLRCCAEKAHSRNVRVALEPLNRYEADFINTAEEGMSLVQEINHPAFGLLLDTFHMNIEEPHLADAVYTAAERLWHLHLGDSNRLPPGKGHFNFSLVVDALRDIGYTGYLSAELLAKPDPDTAARLTMAAMRDLVPRN
jgi:sugar phosphate isomerase/epimerase